LLIGKAVQVDPGVRQRGNIAAQVVLALPL
jgi:hypothetical protein